MNTETGINTMMDALKGFHGRFKKKYGQVALRLDEDTYLMTGANKLLSSIVADDVEICDIHTGDLGEIFTKKKDINAFIFLCSQDTVKVSSELTAMPVALDDLAQLAGNEVPIVEDASPASILDGIKNCPLCLIKGTGAIAVGSDIREVVAAAHILEKSCEAYVHGKMLGGIKPIDEKVALWLKETYFGNYLDTNSESYVNYVGFNEEGFSIRDEIIEFGKDMIKDDLAYGYAGDLSRRINDEEMMISPSSMDYFSIGIEDVVCVNINTLDYGSQRVPSSDSAIHARMYKSLPGCNAILHTHSNGCSVFAACEAGFAISDPAIKQLIGDVRVVPYTPEDPAVYEDNLMAALAESHAVILPHHGALFYGPSLEVVFEIARSVELMARNILQFDARPEDESESEASV